MAMTYLLGNTRCRRCRTGRSRPTPPSPVQFSEGHSLLVNRVLLPASLGPTMPIRVLPLASKVALRRAMHASSSTPLSQDPAEQGRLAKAEEAGEDGDRYFARRVHTESSLVLYCDTVSTVLFTLPMLSRRGTLAYAPCAVPHYSGLLSPSERGALWNSHRIGCSYPLRWDLQRPSEYPHPNGR